MIQIADIPIIEAVSMMTLTPARIMKIDKHKGSITPGKDGDILIFDKEINIQTAMVRGKILYNKL